MLLQTFGSILCLTNEVCVIPHLKNNSVMTPPFFFSLSPPLRATVLWYLDSGPSVFTLSSCAVSQTAKLDELAIQTAENSCMKTYYHLDNLSLKWPGNVSLIQTHFVPRLPPSLLHTDLPEKARKKYFFSILPAHKDYKRRLIMSILPCFISDLGGFSCRLNIADNQQKITFALRINCRYCKCF